MVLAFPCCLTSLNSSPALRFHWLLLLPLLFSFFDIVLGQRWVSIWTIPPLEDWKQQQQQARWWGSCVLFVKVNLLPTDSSPGRGPRSPECQKTRRVSDLHRDWRFRQEGSLGLGDVTAEFDGS